MRKLILKMSITVDGFVGGPNGELDMFQPLDELASAWLLKDLWSAGIHLMGRPTFQVMAAYWPGSMLPFAMPMNQIPKIFFTRNGAAERAPVSGEPPSTQTWTAARMIDGDLAKEIQTLKAQPGKLLYAHGGAGFGRSLVEKRLVDEFHLVTYPIAIGQGLALFSGLTTQLPLALVNSLSFSSGVVVNTYHDKETIVA